MALPIKFPFVKVGDQLRQTQDWRLFDFVDANTDSGLLFVNIEETTPTTATIRLFKDIDRLEEVASGTGPANSTINLAESNGSGLNGSVYLNGLGANDIMELIVSLVTAEDINGAVDRADELKLEDPAESDEFIRIQNKVMRKFYAKMQSLYPPASAMDNPLNAFQSSPVKTPGKVGSVEYYARFLWSLNRRRRFEMVGLQNAIDYKEWATTEAMWRLWDTRVEGDADTDDIAGRVDDLKIRANEDFKEIVPWIDVDGNKTPDRPALKSSIRIGRG